MIDGDDDGPKYGQIFCFNFITIIKMLDPIKTCLTCHQNPEFWECFPTLLFDFPQYFAHPNYSFKQVIKYHKDCHIDMVYRDALVATGPKESKKGQADPAINERNHVYVTSGRVRCRVMKSRVFWNPVGYHLCRLRFTDKERDVSEKKDCNVFVLPFVYLRIIEPNFFEKNIAEDKWLKFEEFL